MKQIEREREGKQSEKELVGEMVGRANGGAQAQILGEMYGAGCSSASGSRTIHRNVRHHSFDVAPPDLEDPSRFNHDPCTLTSLKTSIYDTFRREPFLSVFRYITEFDIIIFFLTFTQPSYKS